MKIVWPTLHPAQYEVAIHPARFKVLAAGRRFGKSKLGAWACSRAAMKGGFSWWVSPTYKMALMGWRELLRFGLRFPGAEINRSDRTVTYPGGGYVQIRSASDPDSLRGEGLGFVFLDEFAYQERRVWTHSIRPALADVRGRALFGSTPFGQNHFWEMYTKGLKWGQPDGGEFMSWNFPSTMNPFLDPDELALLRQVELEPGRSAELLEMPEDAFRQEHLAEFLPDGAGVFRGIDGILDETIRFRERVGHSTHVIGWDPAKFVDFNVVTVLDLTKGEVVLMERSNRKPLMEQLREVIAISKRFPGPVILDATRDTTLAELAGANGLHVEALVFTEELKRRMVNSLALAIENRRFRMPKIGTEIAVAELKSFRYELGKTGHVRYSAPAGMHDDHVTSLGLCALGMGSRLVYTKPKDAKEIELPTSESYEEGWASL